MDAVYVLSPKGQRECGAERPVLLRELHDLLRMVDGRRTRSELLTAVGTNAITVGGLRWLTASGYINPQPPPEPQDLSTRAVLVTRSGETRVREALANFMTRSIDRHLGDAGAPYRRRVERAATAGELLPLLNPLLEAVLARAGSTAAAEFADAAALLLQPLEQRTQ